MSHSPQALHKGIPSKYVALLGIALFIVGGLAFLNSLGSGGGYFATALVISGLLLVIGAIVRGVIRTVSRR